MLVAAFLSDLSQQGSAQTTGGAIVAPDSIRANKGLQIGGSKVSMISVGTFTLDPPNVLAATSGDMIVTVSGLDVASSWTVFVSPQSDMAASLGIVSARVSADNTIKVRFVNPTILAIDQGSMTFSYLAVK